MPTDDKPFVAQDGRRHTWTDVHTHLQRILYKRYPRVNADIMQDAVQEAVLDLLEYWQGLESAEDSQGGLSFELALNRGVKRAGAFIASEVEHYQLEVSYAFGTGPSIGDDDGEESHSGAFYDFPDLQPGPEELACEHDEVDRVRGLLANLPAEELEACFLLMEEGSTRELATKLGVSHMTVARRQRHAAASVATAVRAIVR